MKRTQNTGAMKTFSNKNSQNTHGTEGDRKADEDENMGEAHETCHEHVTFQPQIKKTAEIRFCTKNRKCIMNAFTNFSAIKHILPQNYSH